jgi:hypothetical protein
VTALNLWVHAHPWIVIGTALCLGGSFGMLIAAVMMGARDGLTVRTVPDMGELDIEAQRAIVRLIHETRGQVRP